MSRGSPRWPHAPRPLLARQALTVMPAFTLKRFQEQALAAMDSYLRPSRLQGAQAAFTSQTAMATTAQPLARRRAMCLRTTGRQDAAGGACVADGARWPGTRTPNPGAVAGAERRHPRADAGGAVRARPSVPVRCWPRAAATRCGHLDDVALLSPQDFDAHAVVVVAAMQSFRVEDTEQRNVYAFSEGLEPHFRGVPPAALQVLRALPRCAGHRGRRGFSAKAGRAMLARFVGQPRWSLANWLALRGPYVIVDEARNAQDRAQASGAAAPEPRADPGATATPLAQRTNVLFHVSAQGTARPRPCPSCRWR